MGPIRRSRKAYDGEIGITAQVHLFQGAAAIGADGLGAEGQFLGDFGDLLAERQEANDMKFSVGETFVRSSLGPLADVVGQPLGHFLAQVLAAGDDLADGQDQLFGSAFLRQVP